jgi:hypothetical protein
VYDQGRFNDALIIGIHYSSKSTYTHLAMQRPSYVRQEEEFKFTSLSRNVTSPLVLIFYVVI